MFKPNERQLTLLTAIGNLTRLKILLALWKAKEELSIYRICRFTGLGRSAVRKNISTLIESGLVSKKLYGEISLYTINKDSLEVNALIDFFKKVRL